jgi:hypothetical protein
MVSCTVAGSDILHPKILKLGGDAFHPAWGEAHEVKSSSQQMNGSR